MKDKVVIVTGATNGIGEVAALELAKLGATVVLISRSQSRLDEVVNRIKAEAGNPSVSSIQADLSSMAEVRKAAESFLAQHSRLDVLLNNAGAMFMNRQESVDGHEMTFALNHLNYFLLTHLLLDKLKETAERYGEARVVNVSSDAHEGSKVSFDDLKRQKSYNGFLVYAESKLMNILFTNELARRLKGTGVTANSLHPGVVRTGFGKNNGSIMTVIMSLFQGLGGISAEKGAKTMVYLSSSLAVKGITGEYWYKEKSKQAYPEAYKQENQAKLWRISEELLGLPVTV
jgi:NAD(P)-dependent dehydrogenase (short-subunit alcohol dehydrogenase family)